MKFNLREIRERTGAKSQAGATAERRERPSAVTQQELSDMLKRAHGIELSQTQIARYEANPDGLPQAILSAWLTCLGTSVAAEEQRTQRAQVLRKEKGPFAKLLLRVQLLDEYIAGAPDQLKDDALQSEYLGEQVLRDLVANLRRKPSVALAGVFDAGKTTLANWLLRQGTLLPESYQPATTVITHIHHIEDRPDWIKERVWLLDKDWEEKRWADKDHTVSHRLMAGDLDSLQRYGTREGEDIGAVFALVFLDAPILTACTIIDHPGHGHTIEEDKRAEADSRFDVLIYLSQATKFMDSVELARLRAMLQRLPAYERNDGIEPLSNLFIVASHAHPGIDEAQLNEKILRPATERMWRNLEPHEFAERAAETKRTITLEMFKRRVFPFYRETPARYEKLTLALRQTLFSELPRVWEREANEMIEAARKQAEKHVRHIDQIEHFIEERASAKAVYETLKQGEAERTTLINQRAAEITSQIKKAAQQHLQAFQKVYDDQVTPEAIERLINETWPAKSGTDEKALAKAAQEEAGNFLLGRLEHQVRELAREKSEPINEAVDAFQTFLVSMDKANFDKLKVEVPFDSRGAFLGGVMAAGGVGALAAWAASYGAMGGYIVSATVLGWFGIGGAGWMSGIAALGGPAVLAAAVAVGLFFLFKKVFGESWQSLLARRVSDEFQKRKVRALLSERIVSYWKDTETAFGKGVEELHAKYKAQLEGIREMGFGETSMKTAEHRLGVFKQAKTFFERIPW